MMVSHLIACFLFSQINYAFWLISHRQERVQESKADAEESRSVTTQSDNHHVKQTTVTRADAPVAEGRASASAGLS